MIHYEHLKYYKKVPKNYFWQLRQRYPQMPDAFKISYASNGLELYYVQDDLMDKVTDKFKDKP